MGAGKGKSNSPKLSSMLNASTLCKDQIMQQPASSLCLLSSILAEMKMQVGVSTSAVWIFAHIAASSVFSVVSCCTVWNSAFFSGEIQF